LQIEDREGISLLRETLIAGDYTPEGFARLLAKPDAREDDGAILEAIMRLPANDATASLIKLFHLGVPIDADEAASALAPLPLERLNAMGLARIREALLEPLVEIFPIAGVFIVSERYDPQPRHHDHVGPVATSTLALAALTIRRPIDAALDLGTGSGFQALMMARHARRVVAVDINPRAVRYACFNALLNELPNVEVREGDLFEPVDGETFDLIVSNPPYVISPDARWVVRDSALRGDAFTEGLVRSLPSYLREDGNAHVMTEWLIAPGEREDTLAALRRWVDGNGCDAILFEFSRQQPRDYAVTWNQALRDDAPAFTTAVERWHEHFEQLGVDEIGWGAIALRRRSGENWVATRQHKLAEPIDPAHGQLQRMFAAEDFLAGRDRQALLHVRFEVPDDVLLDVQFALVEGQRLVRRAALVKQGDLGTRVRLGNFTLELVSRLDGRTPLGEIATRLGAEGQDPKELETAAADAARELLELGLIVPS
jgi:methylase of polypeptide subunit release factors